MHPHLVNYLILTLITLFTAADPLCDDLRYGTFLPQDRVDCLTALSKFPRDKDVRYFVEQPMRTDAQRPWYNRFADPRAAADRRGIVQLPRFMSYGLCNIALYSYRHRTTLNAAPPSRWHDVALALLDVDKVCLAQGKGGANTVFDQNSQPGLGVFVWASGSPFEDVVNQEMGDEFPFGVDPGERNEPV